MEIETTKPAETTTPAAPAAATQPVKPSETMVTKPVEATGTPEKMEGAESKDQKTAEAPKPPEKYELKMPENSQLDLKVIERISAYAKEKGLTNDQAQERLNWEHEAVSRFTEIQKQQLVESQNKWGEELKSDKEFGGDHLEENGQLAFRAAAAWFGEEFVGVLKNANLNHYPPLFKGLVKLGKAMTEDQFVHGGPAPAQKTRAEKFYGSNE